ncbi:hypothetical protein F5X99DRAFT_378922 [Biscogniauxia marginata]|nr:hypothetical protein F5X99DRAFT_378922 [Biscogniauxia marginata]
MYFHEALALVVSFLTESLPALFVKGIVTTIFLVILPFILVMICSVAALVGFMIVLACLRIAGILWRWVVPPGTYRPRNESVARAWRAAAQLPDGRWGNMIYDKPRANSYAPAYKNPPAHGHAPANDTFTAAGKL